MKKLFALLVVAIFSLAGYQAQGQVCRLMRDSIISGDRVSSINDYIYAGNRLAEMHYKDSGSVNVNRSFALLYTGNDLTEIRAIDVSGGSVLEYTIKYTYTAGKISRILVESADTSVNGWSIAHDITYDGGGNMQQMILDPSALSGSPKGIPASFTDMTWSNGNLTSLNLVLGSDTLEMTVVNVDDKNNVYKHMLNTDGAPFLFQAANANNFELVQLANQEVVGGDTFPAGTPVINNSYTYTGNEVETLIEGQSLFSDNPRTTQFIYDCTVGINTPVAATAISVYPNPAANSIQLKNENFRGDVKIFDIAGKLVLNARLNTAVSSLDISSLNPGVYSLEMMENNNVFKGKFVKN